MSFFPSLFTDVFSVLVFFHLCQGAENHAEGADMGLPAHVLRQSTREDRAYALERHIQSRAFGIVYIDVFCTDEEPLTYGKCPTLKRCKERCQESMPKCEYFAWWPEEDYCETYLNCKHTTPGNPDEKNEVFKRLNDCEMEIVYMPNYYMRNIINAFPKDIVRHPYFDMLVGKTPNFECRCITLSWMICMINVRPGSEEELLVNRRLKRDDPAYLLPFYTMRPAVMPTGPEIVCYDETFGRGRPKVVAEIEVIHPDRCIPLEICREGTPGERCPIQDTQFQSGDPVYIESRHVDLVKRGQPVPCVSVAGVRAVAAMAMDQLPEGQNVMYFLFDEAKRAEGVCQDMSNEQLIAIKAKWLGYQKKYKNKKVDELTRQFQTMSASQAGPSTEGQIPSLQTQTEMNPEERRSRREEQRRADQFLQASEDADGSHSSTAFHTAESDEDVTFSQTNISSEMYQSSFTFNTIFFILTLFLFFFVIFLRKQHHDLANQDEIHIAFVKQILP